jgi:hypothetical protein
MKKYITLNRNFVAILVLIISFIAMNVNAFAQEDSTLEKQSASMSLSYKIVNGIKTLKVSVESRVDGKREPVENLIVNLYLNEVKKYDTTTTTGWMGNLLTNKEGVGEFKFTERFNELTKNMHEFHFLATSNSDLRYEDSEAETFIYDVFVKLDVVTEDSISTATATLTKFVDGVEVPLAETEIKLFVKRTFGLFPFGEEGAVTDENGQIVAEVPSDIIGFSDKTLTLIARYEDPDYDGKIEASQSIPWTVMPYENEEMARSLWSTGHNAPIPLVIASVTIILFIWGLILYLVTLLFKIKKESKA